MSGEKDFVHLVNYLDAITTLGCAVGVCFVEGAPQRGHFRYDQGFLDRYERENLSLDIPDKITEVLKHLAIGASIDQISENLKSSGSGVRNRQRAAVTGLQAANITEAVYKAAKTGVI